MKPVGLGHRPSGFPAVLPRRSSHPVASDSEAECTIFRLSCAPAAVHRTARATEDPQPYRFGSELHDRWKADAVVLNVAAVYSLF